VSMGDLLFFPSHDKVVAFDCETTDLLRNRTIKDRHLPKIIEFYSCLFDLSSDSPPEAELELILDPEVPIQPKITKITGLTDEDVRGRPTFFQVATQVRDFLQSAPLVLAHNASFDKEVVEVELERAGIPMVWPEVACTVEATVHLKGARLTLGDLHEHLLGWRFPAAHRARNDVEALVRVARKLRQDGML
jgi:DNA polymerase III epsilon subunit-like protein